jgi:sporulation protein YlmC with PRC-barrel domain
MITLALSELLGATVYDPSGAAGRVREVSLGPDRSRIASLIVKTKAGNRLLPFSAVSEINGGIRVTTGAGEWPVANGTEGLFLLERDLLDQQVIDVNGRKVVRVNDVDLEFDSAKEKILRVHSVDVGARGAIRRLLRGVAPKTALHALLGKIPPRNIPWNFVDVIETDPARRV